MQKMFLTIILSIVLAFSAQAQVFDADSDMPQEEISRDNLSPKEKKALQEFEASGEMEKIKAESSDSPFIPAETKIENDEEPEKVYDNSVGKILEFKVVNGKIQYADPKDRKILIYMENFKVERGMDGIARCSMRIYVLNDLTERINTFGFRLIWPEISTALQMKKVNPGVRTYNDIMLLGNGCFTMDKTPTVEVNRCRVKGKTQEQCASAVHWFKKDR